MWRLFVLILQHKSDRMRQVILIYVTTSLVRLQVKVICEWITAYSQWKRQMISRPNSNPWPISHFSIQSIMGSTNFRLKWRKREWQKVSALHNHLPCFLIPQIWLSPAFWINQRKKSEETSLFQKKISDRKK